jgi:hypothetical protein
MLQALAIPKTEIKALSKAKSQTQFDYVKQRIFEETGEIWEWEGAPKDGKWTFVEKRPIPTWLRKSTKRSPKSKPESKYTRDQLANMEINELRKTYRAAIPYSDRNSEKHTKAEYATHDFMIEAILRSETLT